MPAWLLGAFLGRKNIRKQEIVYYNLEDILTGEEKSIGKIAELTGYNIRKIKIVKIDMPIKQATNAICHKE